MIVRIQRIIQHKKLTSSAFADKIGVPRSTISHIISGRNNPSLEFVQKVLDNFPEIRTEWLVRGEGQMLRASHTLFPDEEYNLADSSSFANSDVVHEENKGVVADTHSESGNLSFSEGVFSDQVETTGKLKDSGRDINNENFERKPALIINESDKEAKTSDKNIKKTVKVLLFYSDGSFSEHFHSE